MNLLRKTSILVTSGLAVALFSSCIFFQENQNNNNNGSSEEAYIKTIEATDTSIKFDDSLNGKKAYIICSNASESEVDNTNLGISFNQRTQAEYRSAEENATSNSAEMTIDKKVIVYDDGYWRDEVRFDVPLILPENQSARTTTTAARSYRDLNDNKFWAQTSSNTMTQQTFIQKKVGSHCRIWYLYNNTNVTNDALTQETFNKLADTIDSIFVKETQVFGTNAINIDSTAYIKADSNTKLDVLVYDLMGDASASQQGGVYGFFRAYDFAINLSSSSNSNECEVIHIDSYFLNLDAKNQTHKVQSTLIHEFQHLLNLCNKYGNYEPWFTEMLSMCAEDVFQNQINITDIESPKGRFNESFDKPYQGFGYWPASTDEKVYNAYANAYAFGAYLMRNYGGIKLIHEIATNNYTNKEAITMALQKLGYTETFESVFHKFGMVYIFTESHNNSKILSLNKSIQETFNDSEYSLGAINLNDYYFKLYNSESELRNDCETNLYAEGQKYGKNEAGTIFGLFGPRIFKSSYQLTEPIRRYGFAVYYLGTVRSGVEYKLNITPKENLIMTLVLKD